MYVPVFLWKYSIIALLFLHALNNLHIFMALAQGCFQHPSTNWPTSQSAFTHTDHPFFTYKPTSSSRVGQDHSAGACLLAVVLALTQPQPHPTIVTIAHHRPNLPHICLHMEAYGKCSLCRTQHWGFNSLKINLYTFPLPQRKIWLPCMMLYFYIVVQHPCE